MLHAAYLAAEPGANENCKAVVDRGANVNTPVSVSAAPELVACLVIESTRCTVYEISRDSTGTPYYTPFDCSSTTPSDFAAFELSIVR